MRVGEVFTAMGKKYVSEVDAICVEFETELRGNGQPIIEHYLESTPDSLRAELLRRLLRIEIDVRQLGWSDCDQFFARFPDRTRQISRVLAEHVEVSPNAREGDSPVETSVADSSSLLDSKLIRAVFRAVADDAAADAARTRARSETTARGAPQEAHNGGGIAKRRAVEPEPTSTTRYSVFEEVARGGMGQILRARDNILRRIVAMKVLRKDAAAKSLNLRDRFLEEAHVTARLDHPGIVAVHDLGESERGLPYFTMKLVEGREFSEIVRLSKRREEGWTLSRTVGVLVKACQTIAYSHSKGVIHRDIKPENIMVGPFGEVYVMDWGLAKLKTPTLSDAPELNAPLTQAPDDLPATPDTIHGTVMGTPAYMPPEQARGETDAIDELSDVYSLGAVLYYVLTGHTPFVRTGESTSAHEVLERVRKGNITSVWDSCPDAPAELVAVCQKAMSLEKVNRYQRSIDLTEDLQAYLDGRVVQAYHSGALAELKTWFLRNRRVALASLATIATIGLILLGTFVQQRRYNRLIVQANQETTVARDAAVEAEGRTRRHLYNANMSMVQREWDDGNTTAVRRLLSAHVPSKNQVDLRSFEWFYFDRLCREIESIPKIHFGRLVTMVTLSHDGSWLAACGDDGALKVWRKGEQRPACEVATLRNARGMLWLSANGQWLIASTPSETRVWRPQEGDWHRGAVDVKLPNFESGGGWNVAGCSGSPYVVAARADSGPIIWRLDDDIQAVNFDELPAQAALARFTADGRQLAVVGGDRVGVWDVATRKLVRELDGAITLHDPGLARTEQLAISEDGRRLAVATREHVIVWDLATGHRLARHVMPSRYPMILLSSQGDRLVVATGARQNVGGGSSHEIQVWGIDDEQLELLKTTEQFDGALRGLVEVPGTNTFATSVGSNTIARVWSFEDGRRLATHRGHAGSVSCLAVAENGGVLVTGSRDYTIRTIDLTRRRPASVLSGHLGTVWTVDFSPDGKTVLTASQDGHIRLWDVATGKRLGHLVDESIVESFGGQPRAHAKSAQFLVFPPNEHADVFATCGEDSQIKLWSLSERRLIRRLGEAEGAGFNSLAFSRNGELLCSAGDDGRVIVWDTEAKSQRYVMGPYSGQIWPVACSPSDDIVAASGKDHTIRIWSLQNGELLRELTSHGNNVTSLCFSYDGKTLVSTSHDRTIRFWDVATGTQRRVWTGHSGDVQYAAFTPDGKTLATTSSDRTVRLWDVRTGETKCVLTGHTRWTQLVAFSRDGATMATCSWDGTARLWRTR